MSQRGAGSVLVIGIIAALVGLFALAVPLYTVLAERTRIAGAADAAALAAADSLSGAVAGLACDNAAIVARANGAEVERCATDGLVATVRVSASVLGFAVTATATAGPPGSQ